MIENVKKEIKKFHENESGDIVQTGIILGILAVLAVGALTFLKPYIKGMFEKAADTLDNAGSVSY